MPVVAVCPVHGAFPSRMIDAHSSRGITISSASEPCPQCGRRSAVMEGTFDFDADGIVTVLSAPQWTRDAIERVQRPILDSARAMSSRSYSDDRALAFMSRKLDQVQSEVAALRRQSADQAEQMQALIDALRTAQKKKPRSVVAKMLYGTWLALGALATIGGAYQMLSGVFEWGFNAFAAGYEPQLTDVPPSLLRPEPSPGPPPGGPK